jgi:hypothetical protein
LTSSTVYTLGGEAAKATLPKFSSEITVNAKREHVFEIFSNYANYQNLVPQHYPSVRIRSVRGDLAVVEEHFNLGETEMLVMARHISKKPVLHEVFIIGGDAKGSHIKQEFIKLENGTKVLIDADFKFKGKMKISYMFGKNTIMQDYDVIMSDFAKIAEN